MTSSASERRRPRRKYVLASTVVVGVLVGGAAVVATNADHAKGRQQRTDGLPQRTDTVQRQDLSSRTQVDGTLGYSEERKANGGAQGTVTWLPDTGAVIRSNEALYEADGKKIWLMYGERPMYRKLKAGDNGPDVRQLKQNLRDLGYGAGLTVDEEYTPGTADAVKRWQKSHGLRQTGETGPDQIAFAPGSVRVKKREAAVGDQTGPGRPLLTLTGAEREVQIKLDVADAGLAEVGTRVEITLPSGDKARGRVSSVDRSASSDEKDQGAGGQDQSAKITARIAFTDPGRVKGVDQAPVTVDLQGETHRNVLTVPVNALLALPAGGFGVQVVEDGRAREVPVTLGLFGQGRVEVNGSGLKEGMKVGVPKA
ncbi:peptidoglycan-binding protein [Streptomyces sp. NPDC057743]|uniref:peptidoglycan-binding protein n=1 Tax=Streptomyces sp. NPDC057743 TaxID=3346236 RepID=UPI0036C3D634